MVIRYNQGQSTDYDLILVGAGSAACLIASRVSQTLPHKRILVLEAGEHLINDPKVQTPGRSSSMHGDPHYDWQYVSAPEPKLNGRRMKHPRGKLVGGSSAINSHSVVFPNHEWQDRIAEELLPASAAADWSAEGMKDCYERFQAESFWSRNANRDQKFRDAVQVSYPPKLDTLQLQWMEMFDEMDHATSKTGFAKSRAAALTITNAIDAAKGERSHAGTAFLDAALETGNVVLRTGVKVDRLAFEKERSHDGKLNARGVWYTHEEKRQLVTAREIILCAGTFESPGVLERSGIGSAEALSKAGVPMLYSLPGVGENLQDHLNCSSSWEVEDDIPTHDAILWDEKAREAAEEEYERSRTGLLAEGPAHSFAFASLQMLERPSETQELIDLLQRHMEQERSPNLQAQYSLIRQAIENPEEATASTFMIRMQRHRDLDSLPEGTPDFVKANFVTLVAMLSHPFSRGSCHISADPSQRPEIKFNYLSHPLDLEILARHMRLIERLFQKPSYKAITKPDGRRLPLSYPYPITTLEDGKKMLPSSATTNYHPCGTCSMMREELGGVVDERLRVYGTRNIRVCDASVLPVIPRGNILVAVYAFAEKAAEIVCRETMD